MKARVGLARRGRKIRCEKCGSRFSADDPRAHPPAKCQLMQATRRVGNKFGAERTADGFPSRLERDVYQELCLLERAGEIRNIRRQHAIAFPCGTRWKIDFSYEEVATGDCVFVEAKGAETETYRLKRNQFGGCPILQSAGKLEVWKSDRGQPTLVETIRSKARGGVDG